MAPMPLKKDMTEKFPFFIADKTVVAQTADQEEEQETIRKPLTQNTKNISVI